jgi:hypothetical protein
LSWEKHIDKMCKKASAGIGAIKRAKPYVDINTLQTIYKALVQPYFNYCSTLWGNCGKLLQDKLQRFQSRYNLRNSENDLTLPNPRTEYLKRSFKYMQRRYVME